MKAQNVGELIEELSLFLPHTRLVVRGFDENGFDDVTIIKGVRIIPVQPGSHGPTYAEESDATNPTGEPFDAILID